MNKPTTLLRQFDKDIAATDKELTELQRYRQGLQVARDAVSAIILDGATESRNNGKSRVAIVQEILASSPEPVTVAEIVTQATERGVIVEKSGVSSTLGYLARKKLVKNPERGRWTVVSEKKAA